MEFDADSLQVFALFALALGFAVYIIFKMDPTYIGSVKPSVTGRNFRH